MIAIIKPYIANASQKATTKNALKKLSSLSDRADIAVVPTVFKAIALPTTAAENDIAAEIAKIAAVGELK